MSKPNILVQLDSDSQPSVFDGVVAVDAGVAHLFRHGGVHPDAVRDLVYGAMFTRGGNDLCHTAVFIGGSDVTAGEQLLKAVTGVFFGPMRVSVMLDSNGANTTAAAAVLAAEKHLPLAECQAIVLAGTGPVGSRVARLLALAGTNVRVASRSRQRAQAVCDAILQRVPTAQVSPLEVQDSQAIVTPLSTAQLVISAGAPGIELAGAEAWQNSPTLRVAIDLSAVPPTGLAGIEVTDRGSERAGKICYGAIGVGGTKMKIHKAAIQQLFTKNDLVLDAEEIYRIGQNLTA